MHEDGPRIVDADLSGARWRKSRYSGPEQECVEVADDLPGIIGIRDSKNRKGPALVFTRSEWNVFIAQVKLDNIG
jgi:hypothetical protein